MSANFLSVVNGEYWDIMPSWCVAKTINILHQYLLYGSRAYTLQWGNRCGSAPALICICDSVPFLNSFSGAGGSFGGPLYNFKTAHDTATKIQNNVFIISNI